MNDNPIIVTSKHIFFSVFSFLTTIFIGALTFIAFRISFSGQYFQLLPFLLSLVLCFFTSFNFINIIKPHQLKIYHDRLEIFILGYRKSIIRFDEINSCTEYIAKNKRNYLILTTKAARYKISSHDYEEYDQIKSIVTSGKQLEIATDKNRTGYIIYIVFTLSMSLSFLSYSVYSYFETTKKITANNLVTIGGKIMDEPIVSRISGHGGRTFIGISLNDYPGFSFEIEYTAFQATNTRSFVTNVRQGDSLFLDILADDYKTKILGEKQLAFFDKTVNYNLISIYGLRDANNQYLRPDDYNHLLAPDERFYKFGLFGLFFMFVTIYVFREAFYKKAAKY